ncbi:MAG: hypothetical protein GY786_00760 [Proteobacteria bacterium]|nr:hypothetical protein [Pseudomonadota bacterium]
MAKKKKQKKAGLAKRQSNKQNKKRALKRKEVANKPVEKKQMKMSRVKKNLKKLPLLVFESELQEILFTPDQLKQAEDQFEKAPDQVEVLATPDFESTLKEKLLLMDQRFLAEGNADYGMMVKAMLYFMEQEQAPGFLNQIIVSIYFYSLAKANNPDSPYGFEELETQLNDYDDRWETYLEEKTAALQKDQPAMETAQPNAIDNTPLEEDPLPDSPFEVVLKDFNDTISADNELDESQKERIEEDVEALINDYFEEKEISSLEGFNARKLRNFIESWFIRNMHPTPEDLENMIGSLKKLTQFLETKELVPKDECQKVLTYLDDKNTIMDHL